MSSSIVSWSLEILSVKKEAKLLASEVTEMDEGKGDAVQICSVVMTEMDEGKGDADLQCSNDWDGWR